MSDTNLYGFCPHCGEPGETRERRPNGNDTCKDGHVYPSSKALTDSDDEVVTVTEGPIADALRNAAVNPEEEEERIIEEVYVTTDGSVLSSTELADNLFKSYRDNAGEDLHVEADNDGILDIHPERLRSSERKDVKKKTPLEDGSTQDDRELHNDDSISYVKQVQPPYPPTLMSKFLEVNEIHFRSCSAKATDAVGRVHSLEPKHTKDGEELDASEIDDVDKEAIKSEKKIIRDFMSDCNSVHGFEGVLMAAAMDHEAIGWGAIEVVRGRDMKIKKIFHVPASRIRVLRGWKGFVETLSRDHVYAYYQMFGSKVQTKDGEDYNPMEHGELSTDKLKWNMVDRETGEPTDDFNESANEILWVPRLHPSTIYYGFSDVVPALGDLLMNVHIRDFMLQFFEHNTVPQYAIIIEGAKISAEVQQAITNFFSSEVKGKAHKTLIVPVPAMGGEVKVKFERLTSESREGSFQETKKNGNQGIMVAHGTPPAILGIAETANLGSGKGLSQAEIYKDRTVTPSQMLWARHINRLFRAGLGVKMVSLSFTPLDIRDLEAQKDVMIGYLEKGVLTINEIRERVGLGDPIEGGNRAFILSGQGPMFVDELDQASMTERAMVEDEIATLRDQSSSLQMQARAGSKPPGSTPPATAKPATPAKPMTPASRSSK